MEKQNPKHDTLVVVWFEEDYILPMVAKCWSMDDGEWFLWVTADSDYEKHFRDEYAYECVSGTVLKWSYLPLPEHFW